MTFTGINYRSVPATNSLSLDVDSISLIFSGDKHDLNLASGVHFGFSGASDSISFSMVSGKVYDPENRVVYSYSEQNPFSMSLDFDASHYSYSFNNAVYSSNGLKSNFNVNKFFFNCNGYTVDTDLKIYGDQIIYDLIFPETYSSNLTGIFTNKSSSDIKIFSGEITFGDPTSYSLTNINNITVNANSSSNVILIDGNSYTGVRPLTTLTLYTNFGAISETFQSVKF